MHTNNGVIRTKPAKPRKPYNKDEKQEKGNKAKRIDKRQLLVL